MGKRSRRRRRSLPVGVHSSVLSRVMNDPPPKGVSFVTHATPHGCQTRMHREMRCPSDSVSGRDCTRFSEGVHRGARQKREAVPPSVASAPRGRRRRGETPYYLVLAPLGATGGLTVRAGTGSKLPVAPARQSVPVPNTSRRPRGADATSRGTEVSLRICHGPMHRGARLRSRCDQQRGGLAYACSMDAA